jgi:hypothetical protein
MLELNDNVLMISLRIWSRISIKPVKVMIAVHQRSITCRAMVEIDVIK